MNDSIYTEIQSVIKAERARLKLTQEDLSARTGLGLRFIRELEQGKKSTVRMDKVLELLAFFGHTLKVEKGGAK